MSRTRLGWVLAGLGLVVAIRLWMGAPLSVHTRGMLPQVQPGDVVWVYFGAPQVGDVVSARMAPDEPLQLARVVATQGQAVEASDGVLYVDGMPAAAGQTRRDVACEGPHILQALERWQGQDVWVLPGEAVPLTRVPAGHAWLQGDNRSEAGDSQRWGAVPVSQIEGVAAVLMWPSAECVGARWSRFLNRIK